jgi:hypothetical protein
LSIGKKSRLLLEKENSLTSIENNEKSKDLDTIKI